METRQSRLSEQLKYEDENREFARQGRGVIERAINGEEVSDRQFRASMLAITDNTKFQQANNGRISKMITIAKTIEDQTRREEVTMNELQALFPQADNQSRLTEGARKGHSKP